MAVDVAVEIFGCDFFHRHAAGVGGYVRPALGEAAAVLAEGRIAPSGEDPFCHHARFEIPVDEAKHLPAVDLL